MNEGNRENLLLLLFPYAAGVLMLKLTALTEHWRLEHNLYFADFVILYDQNFGFPRDRFIETNRYFSEQNAELACKILRIISTQAPRQTCPLATRFYKIACPKGSVEGGL